MTKPIEIAVNINPEGSVEGSKAVQQSIDDIQPHFFLASIAAQQAQVSTQTALRTLAAETAAVNVELIKGDLEVAQRAGWTAQQIEENIGRAFNLSEKASNQLGAAFGKTTQMMQRNLESVAATAATTGREVEAQAGGGFGKFGQKAGDVLSDIKGGLLAASGIAGGIGGIVALAAGPAFSTLVDLAQADQKAWEEVKQHIDDAYKSAADEGRDALTQAQIVSAAQDILFDSGKKQAAADAAKKIGVDVNTYILAQAGSYKDLQAVIAATQAAEDKRAAAYATEKKSRANQGGDPELNDLNKILTANQKLIDLHDEDAAAARDAQAIKSKLADQETAAIAKTAKASSDRYTAEAQQLGALAKTPVVVKPTVDLTGAAAAVDAFTKKQRDIKIRASIVNKYGAAVV
ncbi:MAG TPA: hypothetical protein VGM94_02740 [Galbitalea sp.]|jgi:hypothetical protein